MSEPASHLICAFGHGTRVARTEVVTTLGIIGQTNVDTLSQKVGDTAIGITRVPFHAPAGCCCSHSTGSVRPDEESAIGLNWIQQAAEADGLRQLDWRDRLRCDGQALDIDHSPCS